MKAISLLTSILVSVTTLLRPIHLQAENSSTAGRTLKICVASDAPPEVKQAAAALLTAVPTSPLLSLLAAHGAALADSASLLAEAPESRAFNHLILVGLPDDPLIRLAWQHEARAEDGGFYIFDFGHLRGTLGYLESDRNPFLHSPAISSAPFETEVITLTGSNPAGVRLAVDAFLSQGLVNGVVAAPGWTHSSSTLLDHDPLPAGFTLPAFAPATAGSATRIGVTQAGESEYRGVLQDTGIKPVEIWRFKYALPGGWDGSGAAKAKADYLAGLHRRAFGNTLWLAKFSDAAQALEVGPKIAAAAHLRKQENVWTGTQPSDPWSPTASGPVLLWTRNEWVFMSTVPQLTP